LYEVDRDEYTTLFVEGGTYSDKQFDVTEEWDYYFSSEES
jgi:hypothetical protein